MVESVVEELARKRLGRTIKGKWRLDRLIGVGGMAAVYAATHRNGARVALKMLHPTISASQQIRARFIREGYLANKVDHPGVVRVLDDDVDDADQSAFLVMDLVIGTTLAERAMERLLDAGEVLDVADQVLQVLEAAHQKGIVHRDLKPDNLLVDKAGKVHVLDFGIARLLDDTGMATATKTGTAFGTPGFMAPEQALGKTNQISPRSDLYALGATLFALVCGDFVHAAENPQELLVLVATQPARSLAELAPHMARDVVEIIDRATRNAPDARWPSAAAMLEAVRAARAKLGVQAVRVLPVGAPGAAPQPPPPLSDAKLELPKLVDANDDPASIAPVFTPSHRLSSPDALTIASLPSPAPAVQAPSPFAIASESEPRVRRPKLLPVALVFGGALVIGAVAIVAASSGPSAATKASPEQVEPSAEPSAPSEPEPASEPTGGAEPAGGASAEPATSGSASEAPPATAKPTTKPNAKLPPTAGATAKPPAPTTKSTGGKKYDIGY